jgi:methylmalonyl-CoA mutase N-terminal domain/subunit
MDAAKNNIKKNWLTPEQIPVKPVYTKEDLEGMEHLNYAAGLPPYLRGLIRQCIPCNHGPSASMQVFQLPKNRMHSTAATWLQARKGYR